MSGDTTEDRAAEFGEPLTDAERYELFSLKEREIAWAVPVGHPKRDHHRNAALWSIAKELAAIRETLTSLHFTVRTPVTPEIDRTVELANEGESK